MKGVITFILFFLSLPGDKIAERVGDCFPGKLFSCFSDWCAHQGRKSIWDDRQPRCHTLASSGCQSGIYPSWLCVWPLYCFSAAFTSLYFWFQTTKGASAFKICRGVEAVGGSLRSVYYCHWTASSKHLLSIICKACGIIQWFSAAFASGTKFTFSFFDILLLRTTTDLSPTFDLQPTR